MSAVTKLLFPKFAAATTDLGYQKGQVMRAIEFVDLETEKTPREILESDFPSIGVLPIRGGWGYSQFTACIIDKSDPAVDPRRAFNFVGLEYTFVKCRLYEELINFRPKGHQYADIRNELSSQRSEDIHGQRYDIMNFQVTALREGDFFRLKAIFEGPEGVISPSFDFKAHQELHSSLLHFGSREYWFDITSFIGTGETVH